jgi:hypothetical protein
MRYESLLELFGERFAPSHSASDHLRWISESISRYPATGFSAGNLKRF